MSARGPRQQKVGELSRERKTRLGVEILVQSIPYLGGAIHTAVFGRLDEIRMRRLEVTVEELRKRLEVIGRDDKIRQNLTSLLENNERFMLFVRRCFSRVMEEYDQEKFNAYKEALIRGLTSMHLSVNIKLEFIRMLDRMASTELHVLGYLAQKALGEYIQARTIAAAVTDGSEREKLLLLSATDTLANLQLIEVGRIELDKTGLLHRESHEYRLTSLGRDFVEFVQAQSS